MAESIEPRLLSGHSIWARVRLTREADELVAPDVPVLDVVALPDAPRVLAPLNEPLDDDEPLEVVVPLPVDALLPALPPPALWAQDGDATTAASSRASGGIHLMPGQRIRRRRRSGIG